MKKSAVIALLNLLVFTLSCSLVDSYTSESSKESDPIRSNRVNIPRNMKYSYIDRDILKETSCLVTLPNENEIWFGKGPRLREELGDAVRKCAENLTPDKRIVYVKSDVFIDYGKVIQVIDIVRKQDIDKIGFVVSPTDKINDIQNVLEVKIPAEPKDEDLSKPLKPNPNTLVVFIGKGNGKLRLNQDDIGDVSNTEPLTAKLMEIFKMRESLGILREGSNEVEKTVFIKAPKSVKYAEVVKVIDALKASSAYPVGLQIDDLEN